MSAQRDSDMALLDAISSAWLKTRRRGRRAVDFEWVEERLGDLAAYEIEHGRPFFDEQGIGSKTRIAKLSTEDRRRARDLAKWLGLAEVSL